MKNVKLLSLVLFIFLVSCSDKMEIVNPCEEITEVDLSELVSNHLNTWAEASVTQNYDIMYKLSYSGGDFASLVDVCIIKQESQIDRRYIFREINIMSVTNDRVDISGTANIIEYSHVYNRQEMGIGAYIASAIKVNNEWLLDSIIFDWN